MPERHFAIGIDDHDWSREVDSLSFNPSATVRTVARDRHERAAARPWGSVGVTLALVPMTW